jgi:hypothetical protein
MSAVAVSISPPQARGLVVGAPDYRATTISALEQLGYSCGECDDPYAAMAEICRRPAFYSTLVLCLAGLYREELPIVAAVRRLYPHIEVWLAQVNGRQAAVDEGVALGAAGVIDGDGLHQMEAAAVAATGSSTQALSIASEFGDYHPGRKAIEDGQAGADATDPDGSFADPILTAEELRALLQEPPAPVATEADAAAMSGG